MTQLPPGWARCNLGDLCVEVRNGISAKPSEQAGLPILRISAVRPLKLDTSDVRFLPSTFPGADLYTLRANDLLFTRYNGNRELVAACARVHELSSDLTYPDKLIRVRLAQAAAVPAFVEAAAATSEARAFIDDKLKTSAGQVGISGADLKMLPILLAPLAEQQRIADKLDTVLARVDACRDRLARVGPLLKRFRQSVLDAATSGKLTSDRRSEQEAAESWRDVVLGDIADVIGGVTKDSKKQSIDDEEVPYLRVANVQRGYLDLSEVKTIRIPAARLPNLLLRPGDILFNEGGDLDKLGRGWIWEGQIERCSFQNHVFRARLHDPANSPQYVSWWGNSKGLRYFIGAGKQTTNLASINRTMLCGLPIALPPPAEQTEIVRRVTTLLAFADRLEARLARAQQAVDRLTPSLLAKAFRGELVPQDPADEPATELLARLARRGSDNGTPLGTGTRRGRRPAAAQESPRRSNPSA